MVDFYGGMLAQKLLRGIKDNPHDNFLHEQAAILEDGDFIYPIYTAGLDFKELQWMEFTPHEVGSDFIGAYIPVQSMECLIHPHKQYFRAEPDLGYLLGMWGSAFEKYFDHFRCHYLREYKSHMYYVSYVLFGLLSKLPISPTYMYNFAYNLSDHPIRDDKYLRLVDMGVYCNLPIYPLLKKERKVDIIIVLDASRVLENANHLQIAQANAQESDRALPAIAYDEIDSRIISVFHDENHPSAPTIIYMPLIKNETYSSFDPIASILADGYCRTTNFSYTPEQIDEVCGLAQCNMEQSRDVIVNTIEKVIAKKRLRRINREIW
jgi:phospholipase A2